MYLASLILIIRPINLTQFRVREVKFWGNENVQGCGSYGSRSSRAVGEPDLLNWVALAFEWILAIQLHEKNLYFGNSQDINHLSSVF